MSGTVLLDLDDVRCARVEVAGGKGAGLSRARSAGLPVLPGAVLPTTAGVTSMRAGASALGTGGSGAARRAVMAERLSEEVRAELQDLVGRLGGDVIVRSSANVESTGEWAGAFSSFSEIGVDEIDVAVRGCWASAFGVDVVERTDHVGHGPDGLTMSVLIQPRIEPTVSGLARDGAEGSVVIEVVSGTPAALMSGWASGQRITVDADAAVRAPDDPLLDHEQAVAVAALLRQASRLLGHSVIEWAMADGDLVLLQSMAAPPRPVAASDPGVRVAGLAALHHPNADRVVNLALAFPGGLSEELVLPWGLGLVDLAALDTTTPAGGAELDLTWARGEAQALAHQVWRGDDADVLVRAREAMRALRGDTPGEALDAIEALGEPDLDRAQRLVTHLLSAGRTMTERQRLRRPDEIFGCELHEVTHATGAMRQSWAGARRWEPFLAGVGEAQGTTYDGVSASPGLGAGKVLAVPALDHAPTRVPRAVIVAPFPVPALASLLWDAAGLVTVGGSAGAHLIEVARSLGVPAVVGCDELPPISTLRGMLAVVDGDAGVVSLHRCAATVDEVSSPEGAARRSSARPGGR